MYKTLRKQKQWCMRICIMGNTLLIARIPPPSSIGQYI